MINCFLSVDGISQEFKFGNPKITQHAKQSYLSAAQNWAVDHNNGQLFFANNGGLLCYNGNTWSTLSTPNNTIMRSVYVHDDAKIYVGAQGELGYFVHSDNGTLEYKDLLDSLNIDDTGLSEIWDLAVLNDGLYFNSQNDLYEYKNAQSKRIATPSNVMHLAKVQESIWFQTESNGIYGYKENKQEQISGSEIFNGKDIITYCVDKNGVIYVLTEKNGIYKYQNNTFSLWETNANEFLKEKRISSAYYSPEYGLFIGSYLGGLINLDIEGNTTLLLNKSSGLQNNSIHCMTMTPNGILWIGSNNGIDEIDIARTFRRFYPDNNLEGAVYDMDIWKGRMFFSTSNGLYHIEKKDYYNPLKEKTFQLVQGTEGQTWGTDILDGQLYCAHHEGGFIVKENLQTQKIEQSHSAWKFVKLENNFISIGAYQGVNLYKRMPTGDLRFVRKLEGLDESSRIIIFDKHKNLWVSHPYKKVYRIRFNEDYSESQIDIFDKTRGFQSDFRNYVFKIHQTCYLTNETGIYKFNEKKDSFEIETSLSEHLIPDNPIRRLIEIDNQIWCISDYITTRLTFSESGLESGIKEDDIININTTGIYIGGFEELFYVDAKGVILSSEAGAVECNIAAYEKDHTNPSVSIKSISLPLEGDSIIYSATNNVETIQLKSDQDAIKISYNSMYSNANDALQYSMKLAGADDEWSAWTYGRIKEYNNLPHGDLEFQIKSKDIYGLESAVQTLKFEIETPWHKTWIANIFYLLLAFWGILLLLLIPRKKYKENTAQLEQEKKEQEEEIERVKQEKLLNEIKHKNKELASSTLHLLQKNQTIKTLKNKFDELNDQIKNPNVKKELNNILSIFRSDLRVDEDWDKFSFYFDQVHYDFIKKLKAKYPELSTNDHKLCAYLKMNLSTKEIAPLLNISVRGVEISRYRLRKKLQIERSVNLNDFFNKTFD